MTTADPIRTRTPEEEQRRRESIRVMLFVIPTIVMSALIAAVTGLKTSFMIKEQLGLNASDLGTLNLVLGIPSYIQPFIGAWTDMFAFFGYHRRSYYLAGKVLHAASLVGLALLEASGRVVGNHGGGYPVVILLLMLIAAGGIIRTVIFNAILVALGNFTGRFGQLLALINLVPIVMGIVYTAGLSGYVAEKWSYPHAFTMGAILTLLSMPLVFLIDEKRTSKARHHTETHEEHQARLHAKQKDKERTRLAIGQAFRSPGLWALVAFVFYLIITPGVNNTKLYFMQDNLHFSKLFIGQLGRYGSIGALTGYFLYGAVSRKIPVYMLAWGAWMMDCLSYPAMLFLRDHHSAIVLEVMSAIISALYGVCLNTLAARLCPRGLEGVVYGLVMSAIAIAGGLSEKIGGWLYVFYGPDNSAHHYTVQHGWTWSLYVGLGFTVIGAIFIPFLPAWTRSHKRVGDISDGDIEAGSSKELHEAYEMETEREEDNDL